MFWPDQPEFVRMAARFGVTVIPFGCVGEDDFMEVSFMCLRMPSHLKQHDLHIIVKSYISYIQGSISGYVVYLLIYIYSRIPAFIFLNVRKKLMHSLYLLLLQVVVDYNDQKNIPYLKDEIKSFNEDFTGIIRSHFYYP